MKFIKVTTLEQVLDLMARLPSVLALDTEYTHLDPLAKGVPDPRKARLESVILATDADTAYSIPAAFLTHLKAIRGVGCLYLQNFKADYEILAKHGLDLFSVPFRDTMLLHHLVDENLEHGLDFMVQTYFGDSYKESFWSKYESIDQAPDQERLEYECKDAIYTYRLAKTFLGYLHDKAELIEHVHELAKSLYLTEVEGIPVDTPLIVSTKETMGKQIEDYLPALRNEYLDHCLVWEMAKWDEEMGKRKTLKGKQGVPKPSFNFGSDAQVKWLLYDELKLPVLKRTKRTPKGGGNQPSVDYEAIELLEREGYSLPTLKAYKDIKNMYGTFVVGLLERVENGRIYPEFNINGTLTGRISHSNPNMGNMPKEGPYRGFFLPSPGHGLIGADYNQLEVIIEANLTGDKNLIKMIKEGASKHDITMKELGVSRDAAKTINFAMQYRCSPYRIQKIINCSSKEAERLWNKYWEAYKGVRDLQLYCDKLIDEERPIVSPFGRERHMGGPFATPKDKARAQRQGYNSLIQGTGGDCMNFSFAKAAKRVRKSGRGRMLFTVHDEGVGDIKLEYCEDEMKLLVQDMESMTQLAGFDIPLKATAYGPLDRWSKA